MRAPSVLIGCMFLAGCMINSPQPAPRHVPTPAPAAGTTLPRGPASADAVDSGPQAAVDREALKALPDLIARSEPRVAAGNFSPYVVLGQTYEVLNQADDYAEEGLASWYGTKFHGRATSNGEAFDMYTLSAAHKTLPIPSYVRVTNLSNGLATVLRVNDRGPFHDDRLIDLSYAAAVKLGFDLNGTAPVRVECSPRRMAPWCRARGSRGTRCAMTRRPLRRPLAVEPPPQGAQLLALLPALLPRFPPRVRLLPQPSQSQTTSTCRPARFVAARRPSE